MTSQQFNRYCASLPVSSHVIQWGGAQVWKVDGQVFAIGGWNEGGDTLGITFKVTLMAFDLLSGVPGLRPAPYFASRGMKWIQYYADLGVGDEMLREHIAESHHIVSLGLTKKRQKELGLNQP